MRRRCRRTSFGPGAGRARLGRKSGVGMAVRFAVGAKGSHNQKVPPGPPRPPPSHCFTASDCAQLCSMGGAFFLPLSKCSSAVSWEIPEKCAESRVCGRSHEVHRSSQLPSPCGLLPLRRTQNEPMLRKGNVLSCTNRGTFYIALTASLFSLRPSAWRRKMCECARSAAMAGTSGWSRPTTGGTRPAYIKITRCDRLPVYSPARSREPTWREPRIVCAASQDTSTSQGTQRPRSEPPC